jgi:hypothetical protein
MPEGGVVMADGSGAGQSYPDGLDLLFPGNVTPLHVDFASQVVQAERP